MQKLSCNEIKDTYVLLADLLVYVAPMFRKSSLIVAGKFMSKEDRHSLTCFVEIVGLKNSKGNNFYLFFREVKRHLSLVIIAKFLHKKHVEIPGDCDKQVLLPCIVFVEFESSENINVVCLCFMF